MSDKTIPQKLFLKAGQTFLLLDPPEGYLVLLGDLPAGVTLLTGLAGPSGPVDVIQCFITTRAALDDLAPRLKAALKPKGILWLTYPKATGRLKTDLNRDILREIVIGFGLETVALFSVDETWSAMRLKII
jgi:tRNA A37 threonylcarbamoyladenosine biosynthesis protein TsaE